MKISMADLVLFYFNNRVDVLNFEQFCNKYIVQYGEFEL